MTASMERRIAKMVSSSVIMKHDLTLADFTEGSDLPGPDTLSKKLKKKLKKEARGMGILPRILRRTVFNELVLYDEEQTNDGLVVYLGGASDVMILSPHATLIIR